MSKVLNIAEADSSDLLYLMLTYYFIAALQLLTYLEVRRSQGRVQKCKYCYDDVLINLITKVQV